MRYAEAKNYSLFLNIRTDTYLLGHEDALQETILGSTL